VAGPNNFLGQTEAKARYSLVQSLARIWLQQNRIHRSYLEELLPRPPWRIDPAPSHSLPRPPPSPGRHGHDRQGPSGSPRAWCRLRTHIACLSCLQSRSGVRGLSKGGFPRGLKPGQRQGRITSPFFLSPFIGAQNRSLEPLRPCLQRVTPVLDETILPSDLRLLTSDLRSLSSSPVVHLL